MTAGSAWANRLARESMLADPETAVDHPRDPEHAQHIGSADGTVPSMKNASTVSLTHAFDLL